jgi:hypothetical protein
MGQSLNKIEKLSPMKNMQGLRYIRIYDVPQSLGEVEGRSNFLSVGAEL